MPPRRRSQAKQATDLLKGRLAEALVEAMLTRAGHTVTRTGRESQFPRLLKRRKDAFLPDFMVRKPIAQPDSDRPLHQLISVEVKYRRDLDRFLRVGMGEFVRQAAQWPDLCLILVTDHGDSCFQAIDLAGGDRGVQDLEKVTALNIYPSTVREYSTLATRLFPLIDRR